MKSLELFNAVLKKDENTKGCHTDAGLFITPGAMSSKYRIINYYHRQKLSGDDINKTFHKSWKKIQESSRRELLEAQILHYLSTYGSNFQDEIYIPDEKLDIKGLTLKFKVIKSYTKAEMINKCLSMLSSGIALKEETIDNLLLLLVDELEYKFTEKDNIRNNEAIVKIADLYGVLPSDNVNFFRYIMYRSTGSALIIKNKEAIEAIKGCSFNPGFQFRKFGLTKLSEIFNRFKPLFLAFKNKCPKTINKISKLSKSHHQPMVENPLNRATNKLIKSSELHWLKNATIYSMFKALSALHYRQGGGTDFVYRIRNGKSFAKGKEGLEGLNINPSLYRRNAGSIVRELKRRCDFKGKKIFIPQGVKYALPTSEKMFVGNIPTGTRFTGERLAVGVYWKDEWGARDLDLFGMNISGKVGWNHDYKQGNGSLMYSGDITSAPNGAVEYLYAGSSLRDPTLVLNNVYSGDNECEYKIIIGKGDDVSKNYMMNPDNLFMEVKCKSVQNQTILGILMPNPKGQSFVLLNFGAGHCRVSGNSEISELYTKALYNQWRKPLTLKSVLDVLNTVIVQDVNNCDIDLSLDSLEKDTFINLFN